MRADRRYARAPDSLLRAHGLIELAIAALGLAVSLVQHGLVLSNSRLQASGSGIGVPMLRWRHDAAD
jgi:hypothetical protein